MNYCINRASAEYKLWRANVYAKDGWCCRVCGDKADRIEAHHIYPVRTNPELALDEKNGITLCFSCHRLIAGKELELAEVLSALRANEVNSVKLHGNVDNTEPSLAGNGLEGVTTRKRVFRLEQFKTRQFSCKNCGKSLKRHYYRSKRSSNFYCDSKCHAKGQKGTVPINKRNPITAKCEYCGEKMTPTTSRPHRKKRFCNNSCHSKYLWHVKKRKPQKQLIGRWTRKHTECQKCGINKVKHYGRGLCMVCYNKNYWNSRQRQ